MSVDSDRKCERRWPPGFRFHPTDEELVLYHLKRKILGKRLLNPDIIPVLDVYKSDPEDLPHKSPTGDRQWFFFTPRDRYSPASRAHRAATGFGYWKATGKDRTITCNSRSVGLKKTLVFYRGRAPKGLRTDWVMHEYTLTQGELNRSSCHNNNSPPKDYYALYKVYKKSGPGPKNGEQYGAPFREEEWADDEEPIDVHIPPSLSITHHRYPDNIQVRFDNAALMQSPSLTDVAAQNMANSNIPPNPIPDQQHQQIISGSTPQVAGEGETHSPAANSFPQCQGNRIAPTPTNQQSPDFHHVPLSTQGLQLPGAPEVVSAPTDGAEEFFLPGEDFLEVDDLIGTEPTPSSFKDPAGSVAFEDFDGLGDLDVYHDTVMFLNDIGQVDQGAISHPYMNDSLEGNMNGELSYQLPPESGDVNQIGAQLQEHDQIYDTFSSMGTNYETFLDSTSGVADKPMDLLRNENQDPGHEDDNVGFTSEFSSALWAFVDSIPSSPASAAEHALVNRAFERLSSFGRLRVNAVNVNSVGCYDGATVKRTGRRKELFFCSVIGAFCAISWVVVGSFSIFERCSSS